MNHTDDLMVPLNNRLEEDDFEDASGLEAAIDLMAVVPKSKGKHDEHPEKKQKVPSILEDNFVEIINSVVAHEFFRFFCKGTIQRLLRS
jgi:hypothetical protein